MSSSIMERVSQACVRCRRQKLKCDVKRPCLMCTRSGVSCLERTVATDTPPAKRRKSQHSSVTDEQSEKRAKAIHSDQQLPGHNLRLPTSSSPHSRPVSNNQYSSAATAASPDLGSTPGSGCDIFTPRSRSTAADGPKFGANSSAMGFALSVLGQHAANSSTTSVIPGDVAAADFRCAVWRLKTLAMPSRPVMEALIEVYFDRVHWFILLFHRPSFTRRARQLLSHDIWSNQESKEVLVLLAMAAVGLQCVAQDPLSPIQELLRASSLSAQALVDSLLSEIHFNLLDILQDPQIESVQIFILIGTHYIYHGSPSLAWAMYGLAVRTAYALALHADLPQNGDQIASQVRRRCWNAVVVADVFATMIYGRPGSIDGAFAQPQPLQDIDDPEVSGSKAADSDGTVFHMLKFSLYEIIRRAVSKFRLLELRQPLSPTEFVLVTEAMESADASLKAWRGTLPPLFDFDNLEKSPFWLQNDPPSGRTEAEEHNVKKELLLQAAALYLTYYGAVILINRPLIQYKLSQQAMSTSDNMPLNMIPKALQSAVSAALKISRAPISHFENHYVISFAFMQLFIAGVILCIPPASLPFSNVAQDAKSGVIRIIRACGKSGRQSRIAKHSETLLTDLLKTASKREVDNALSGEETGSSAISSLATLPASGSYHDRSTLAVGGVQQSSNGVFQSIGNGHPSSHIMPFDILSSTQAHTRATLEDRNSNFLPGDSTQTFATTWNPAQNMEFHGDCTEHIDDVFGAFGQEMFNLLPDDPLTMWMWGAPR